MATHNCIYTEEETLLTWRRVKPHNIYLSVNLYCAGTKGCGGSTLYAPTAGIFGTVGQDTYKVT